MSRTPASEPDDAPDLRERRRAREALLADRAHAARLRANRRLGVRLPSTLPAPSATGRAGR